MNFLSIIRLFFVSNILILTACSVGNKPIVPYPESAENIHLKQSSGWQSHKYICRMDARYDDCQKYALALMNAHLMSDSIVKSEFKSFPVKADFPAWFDVEKINEGEWLEGDERALAVITPLDNGYYRLYYYLAY